MSESQPSRRDESLSLSAWKEIDDIGDRFEQAWHAGEPPQLEDYLVADWPQEQLHALLRTLLIVELDRRHAMGQRPSATEYQQRFSDDHSAVKQAFAACSATETRTAEHRGTDRAPLSSRKIGPYKLLQRIGEGGMGSVWMAEQEHPVRRRVALKLVKEGLGSKEVLARFEAERQALAMMDHQNIAKVLDAGVTEEGQPYFAMELVQGIPFTEYCDKHKLTPDERLELFVPVCRAIQHAHQKGIIHRDIKPSNVLVTLYDGKPVPKVIDFGLAKALQHQMKLTDKTMFTEFGKVIGTLNYMSPEQAEMNALDVDTRTDIYSLGVMLYELLTGSTPLEKKTAQQQALLNVLQSIREDEPPKPSQRLSDSHDKIDGISRQRQIEPHKLQKILRGELDWIVMKAIEKDRTRRYPTANDFAEDVERFISGEAVEARPPTTAYRLSKFVHKNRGLVATTGIIVSLLMAGIAGTSFFAIQAESARKVAVDEKDRADEKTAEATRQKVRAIEEEAKADEEAKRAREAESKMAAAQESTKQALAESKATLARSNYFLATARWNQNRVAEARAILETIPPEHRNFEWYRARRHFLGSDVTCYGHQSSVASVSFSPDGSRIVSGSGDWTGSSGDNTLKLWDARTGQEIETLTGHTGSVNSVSFSPDGSRIVSGSTDNTLKLWDARTGQEIETLTGHTGEVLSVSFSPDGSRIVSGSWDKTLKLWDARTGQEIETLTGHTGWVNSVSFSPDGSRIVSASDDRTLKLWDARTGQEIETLTGHTSDVTSVSFSPDGSRIVSGSYDQTLKLWDARTGQEIETLTGHTGEVLSVSFSPDGSRIVSGSYDQTLKLWDARTGQEIETLTGHTGEVLSVSFSPDGSRIVSGSTDQTLKLWDARTGQEIETLTGHAGEVLSVSFSPDGSRIVSGSTDNTLKLWDARTGQAIETLTGHTGRVYSVSFSPDGSRIVSRSSDNTLKLWDARTGQAIETLTVHSAYSVSFSPDGSRIVSGSTDNTLKLWDAWTGQEIETLTGHTGWVNSVSFSPDGSRIVSASNDNTLKLWDAWTGQEIETLTGHTGWVNSVSFSPDGSRIVSASDDRTLKLWDARTGQEIETLTGHTGSVNSVSFSPDGSRIVSASYDQTLKLWDARTGQAIETLTGHTGRVYSVSFSPDGSRIVSGSRGSGGFGGAGRSGDNTLKLWDARTGQAIETLTVHSAYSVSFSPDGSRIVSASNDNTLKLWDARTGQEIETLTGHTGWVNNVSFSPDGSRIVSASTDNTLKLWDARTGQEIETLTGHTGSVNSVSFSPDGSRIVSASYDQTLKLWDARTGQAIETLTGHTGEVNSVSFSPDGSRIVSGSRGSGAFGGGDKTLKLWDARTGQEIETLTGHTNGVTSVSFSPDGSRIFSASRNENFVWNAKTGKRLPHEPRNDVPLRIVSPDGRRLVVPNGDNVLLVDRDFKNEPYEKGYRESKSRLDPIWHARQADVAESGSDWFAATVHRAWILRADQDKLSGHYEFRRAYASLVLSADSDTATLVAVRNPIVDEMLQKPLAKVVERDDAGFVNEAIWRAMNVTTGDQATVPQEYQLDFMRHVCERMPRGVFYNTLAKLEDMLGNEEEAAAAAARSTQRAAGTADWHRAQADKAEATEDWLLAVIHRAWSMKEAPQSAARYKDLHDTYTKFHSMNAKLAKPIDLALYPIVEESLKLPQGAELSESDAGAINSDIWNSVRHVEQADVDESDPKLMRLVCEKFPSSMYWRTLAVTEYRLGNFAEAIKAAETSIESAHAEEALDQDSAHPSDLATLCMSHFHLGNQEQANDYRQQLKKAMKLKRWKDDEESNSFVTEVNAVLDTQESDDGTNKTPGDRS